MNNKDFEGVLNGVLEKCKKTLGVKAGEYATEDRLHNFKVAARIQHCTPITALAGMMCKHTVSVYDLIRKHEQGAEISQEMWDEKIGDSINYLILLQALIREEADSNIIDCISYIDPADIINFIKEQIIPTREKATNILNKADDIISCYGFITVQDFLDLLGSDIRIKDATKMCWVDVNDARVHTNGNGYYIDISKRPFYSHYLDNFSKEDK